MQKNVLICHKWDGRSEERWLFWLEKKVAALGFAVTLRALPESYAGGDDGWIGDAQTVHGVSHADTYVVRDDPGTLTILKYLERLAATGKQEPTLLVAGGPATGRSAGVTMSDILPGSKLLGSGGAQSALDIRLAILYGGRFEGVDVKSLKGAARA